jgi:hypothetical protein
MKLLAFIGAFAISVWAVEANSIVLMIASAIAWITWCTSIDPNAPGWSPGFIEDWLARRRAREWARKRDLEAQSIKRLIQKQAEKARRERVAQGLPAELTYDEREEFLTTRRLEYGPWGDDGQSCFHPQRDEPKSTPQA